jgi:hypothetical protein
MLSFAAIFAFSVIFEAVGTAVGNAIGKGKAIGNAIGKAVGNAIGKGEALGEVGADAKTMSPLNTLTVGDAVGDAVGNSIGNAIGNSVGEVREGGDAKGEVGINCSDVTRAFLNTRRAGVQTMSPLNTLTRRLPFEVQLGSPELKIDVKDSTLSMKLCLLASSSRAALAGIGEVDSAFPPISGSLPAM